MAKKSKQIKFTDEEIKSLQDLQSNYENIKNSIGALEVSRLQTEVRLDNINNEKLRLETEYIKLTNVEENLLNELNKKYGPGNLDQKSGVFTPIK